MENKTAEEVYDEFAIPERGNLSRYDVILLMNRHASQQCLENQKQVEKLEGMWQASERMRMESQAEIDRLKELLGSAFAAGRSLMSWEQFQKEVNI